MSKKFGIKDPEQRAERVIEEMLDAQLSGPESKTRRDFLRLAGIGVAAAAIPAGMIALSPRSAKAATGDDIKALSVAYALEKLAINTYVIAAGLTDAGGQPYVSDTNYAVLQASGAGASVMTPYQTLVLAIAKDHIDHSNSFGSLLDSNTKSSLDAAVGTKPLPLPKGTSGGANNPSNNYSLLNGLATLDGFARIATYALAAEIEAAQSYLALLKGDAGLLNSGTVLASTLGDQGLKSIDIAGPGTPTSPYKLVGTDAITRFADIAPVEIQHAALYRAAFALLVGVNVPQNPAGKEKQVVPYPQLSLEPTTPVNGGSGNINVSTLFVTTIS
ncbi:MAG: twin-arginine translocation signal domain-containing protein [Rhizobacter sp.]|nr:twin-arginine translocation signal domain-containing protein [Chlorobiales bacterium]